MADYDVVVIGAGPGGYVAAIRAGQLGMSAAVIEDDNVGGVCLNWGCIPSKALLRNAEVLDLVKEADKYGITTGNISYDYGKAIDRSRQVVRRLTGGVGSLLRKNNVEHISGRGALRGGGTVSIDGAERAISADHIIVATGARARHIPNIPVDGETVLTSREAIVLREVPDRVVIVGGGAIGAEFADIYHSYGAEVTIVEMLPRLVPLEDEEISQHLERAFRRRGIGYKTGAMVKSVVVNDGVATVTVTDADGANSEIECDKVLVAIGVQGNSDGIGLEAAGVNVERGFIPVDDKMRTNAPGVYAIGDVTGKLPLAHVASAQGVTAVEAIAGMNPMPLDYTLMPRATYCRPQIASFGLTEQQAADSGYSYNVGRFPMAASGKALAMGEASGMVKLIVDSEVGELLGAHMIGPEATELLGEVGLSRLLEGTTTELGWLVHPHPTISETIKEAALAAEGEAIHI
ncbi:MAG: dihydrolipoyl dehydrogenase [Chloroflexota bacterium]|nr:dihydrolipoyl dehydrogenase [Chloroflexota bacterium]MDE2687117.1 dihydrolipoyl dehydrogenase [Chloroflexota bacterium]